MKKILLILAVVCSIGLLTPPVFGDGAAVPVNLEVHAPYMVEGTVLSANPIQDGNGVIRTHLFVQVSASRGGIPKGSVVDVTIPGGTVGSITMRASHFNYVPAAGHRVHLLMSTSSSPGVYQIWGADFGARRIP